MPIFMSLIINQLIYSFEVNGVPWSLLIISSFPGVVMASAMTEQHIQPHRVTQTPTDYIAGIHVNNGKQIHKTV
jgi:hypothetical protein